MVRCAFNLSTQEMKARASGSRPLQIHRDSEVSLGYMRFCLKEEKRKERSIRENLNDWTKGRKLLSVSMQKWDQGCLFLSKGQQFTIWSMREIFYCLCRSNNSWGLKFHWKPQHCCSQGTLNHITNQSKSNLVQTQDPQTCFYIASVHGHNTTPRFLIEKLSWPYFYPCITSMGYSVMQEYHHNNGLHW